MIEIRYSYYVDDLIVWETDCNEVSWCIKIAQASHKLGDDLENYSKAELASMAFKYISELKDETIKKI